MGGDAEIQARKEIESLRRKIIIEIKVWQHIPLHMRRILGI